MSRESSSHLSCLGDSRKTTKGRSDVQWQATFRVNKNKSQDRTYLDHMPLSSSRQHDNSTGKRWVKRFIFCSWTFSCFAVYQSVFAWNNAWLTGLCLETRLLCARVCLVTIHNLACTEVQASLPAGRVLDKLLWPLWAFQKDVSTSWGGMGLMVVKAVLRIFPLGMYLPGEISYIKTVRVRWTKQLKSSFPKHKERMNEPVLLHPLLHAHSLMQNTGPSRTCMPMELGSTYGPSEKKTICLLI